MKIKSWVIAGIIIAILAVGGYFLFFEKSSEELKTTGEVIRVAKYYWPGEYWIEIADQKGWFEEAGLNVELVDSNLDYYQSLQDTVDGRIDINNFALFDVISYNANGADLVMIINADSSSGADALVADLEIQSLNDLIGKKVGVSQGYYTEYILDVVLKENGIPEEDIIKVYDFTDQELPQKFEEGELDAFLSWDSIVSEGVDKGGHIIWDTSDLLGISPNGQVVHRSFIEERPEDLQAYTQVWHKTTEFIIENPDEAYGIIAEIYGVSKEEVENLTNGDKILDLRENTIAFSYASGFESLHGSSKQINDFMLRNGVIDKNLDSLKFIDSRFIKAIKPHSHFEDTK